MFLKTTLYNNASWMCKVSFMAMNEGMSKKTNRIKHN